MNVVLVGYGRMGRAVEAVALDRGHRITAVVDPTAPRPDARREIDAQALSGAEAAFEFTTPSTAEDNVCALLAAGLPVVCGSTGWAGTTPRVDEAARAGKAGAVIAANFSIGMNLFYGVVAEAARTLQASGLYEPWIFEAHHRGKADAPSGTAKHLAGLLASRGTGIVSGFPGGAVPAGAVHVASVRAGHEPGRHTVGFDGEHDEVTLTHRARGRAGLAFGAVVAAEWLRGRSGVYGFDAVLADLLQKGGSTR